MTARAKASVEELPRPATRLSNKYYEQELTRLQVELVKQQEYIRARGLRVVVIFEGRDAAGKGGAIQRITESLNPRAARIVALPAPPGLHRVRGSSRATEAPCPGRAGQVRSTGPAANPA